MYRKCLSYQFKLFLKWALPTLFYGWDSRSCSVFTSAALARWNRLSEGSVGLINGVLRQAKRNGLPDLPPQKVKRISIEYSVPEWIVRRWLDSYGATQAEEMAKERFRNQYNGIRINTSKTTLKKIRETWDLHGEEYANRYLEVDSNLQIKKLLESKDLQRDYSLFKTQQPMMLFLY
jgi:16S rRNA (cytosine967-C5)-methyltransferase